ncbi:IS110 family RNA-guided transposase [Marinigracilibium pacificum]|uniref:IS110 family transposase n=1 Tax=Marinigracilibium pacificum TaxID=2729599 RepID=A0A848J2H9_9BACT|nr:IS110 family transposase [Marinigracilibium pacificum]NMM48529.1 IS110 family transposase [Marinigracilibium pacificum]
MITGIDCSKDIFDVVMLNDDQVVFEGLFSNDLKGFKSFLKKVKDSHLVVMEATGPYYLPLALFLYENKVNVSIINPLVIKRFSQMRMIRAKTDRKDALVIAQYGQVEKPKLWEPPSALHFKIQQLNSYSEGLIRRRAVANSQLHAFECSGQITNQLRRQLKIEIQDYDTRIRQVEKEVQKLLEDAYGQVYQNLQTIPGIGPKSAALLLIMTNGFESFESYKQVISYFGLAPRIFQSGSSVYGKSKICKMGMSKVRKTLYMAARSAIKCNKACKELYERLRSKGKSHRLALIAAANKLIKQSFAIVKNNMKYNPAFVSVLISK